MASDENCTPPELVDIANKTTLELLPTKSKEVYIHCYQQFMDWRRTKNTNSFSENVILAYFTELAKTMKSSTLWKIYSMLRTTVNIKHNTDLSQHAKLRAFLKIQATGFQAKKSKTLTAEEVKFIFEAPDTLYLGTKVALIVGIMGACRKCELYLMKIQHVQNLGTTILISIPDTKTNIQRQFTITGKLYDVVKKYVALRPANAETDHFFLNYQKGRCTKQVIGINKLGSMPQQVATFLNLPNPKLYTGHSFRRTSATLLIDSGGDITALKRFGGWKSTEVAEGYIDNSLNTKINVSEKIMTHIIKPGTSTQELSSGTSKNVLSNKTLTDNGGINVPDKIMTQFIEPGTSCSGQSISLNSVFNKENVTNAPNLTFHNCNITMNFINKE